jgi:hypothetical protein
MQCFSFTRFRAPGEPLVPCTNVLQTGGVDQRLTDGIDGQERRASARATDRGLTIGPADADRLLGLGGLCFAGRPLVGSLLVLLGFLGFPVRPLLPFCHNSSPFAVKRRRIWRAAAPMQPRNCGEELSALGDEVDQAFTAHETVDVVGDLGPPALDHAAGPP